MTTTEIIASPIDRFTSPLYTGIEVAAYLDVPKSTVTSWASGYRNSRSDSRPTVGAPVLTTVSRSGSRAPWIPFIGLAEGYVLAAIRREGVPLQRIRPAIEALNTEFGIANALASQHRYTDGAEVLFDYFNGRDDCETANDLIVVRNGQHVFRSVVSGYLRRIQFGADGYAQVIPLPAYRHAHIVVDPRRGFGQPTFEHGGARLADVLSLFRSGEPLSVVADEFGLSASEIEDAVRVAITTA